MSLIVVRGRHSSAPQELEPPVAPSFETLEQVHSPYEFVGAYEHVLARSAEAWRDVAHTATTMQSPAFIESLEEGIVQVSERWDTAMLPQTVQKEARRLSNTFAIHNLLVARYISLNAPDGSSQSLPEETYRRLFGVKNTDVAYVSERANLLTGGVMQNACRLMVRKMHQADACADLILTGLTLYNDRHSDGVIELADLYRSGIADSDSSFKELREIIATDWHHYDPAQSNLRLYCADKSRQPSRYRAEFAHYVAETTGNKKIEALQAMAQFAIKAAQQHGLELSVEEAIAATFDDRENYKEFAAAFNAFMDSKKTGLEDNYSVIAGLKSGKNFRLPRTLKEIEEFKANLYVNVGSREVRRRNRVNRRRKAQGCMVPDDAELQKFATAEIDQAPRKIMIAKNVDGICHLEEISSGKVIDTFSISDGNGHLKEDVEAMVDHLRREPISPATKRLQSTKITVRTASGKQVTLPMRRFAPEQAGGTLQVHGGNRFYRIVYALVDNGLVITNILSHEAYNKAY